MVTDIDDLKIYFIHEGAGYKNQLKLTMTGGTYEEGLVFVDGSQGGGSNQLRKGDYVNVGDVAAGTTLDFALLANGYGRTNFHTYYADIDRNPDGLQHVMAYDYQGYLILAWEDLYNGGDKDYNDIVFAVDIGETNLERIPSDPVVNRPPAAAEDQAITPYETEILIDVMANDTDPDQDSISITDVDGFLSSGTVQIQGDKVLYTPEDDYYGTDTFTYTIEDIHGGTNSATVTVEVEKIAAEATDDSLRTPEDVLGTLNVLDNDSTSSDNSTLTVIKVNDEESKVGTEITLTSGAKVKIESDGELTYDPNGSFNSLLDGDVDSDSFSYSIDDGKGGESTATVNVTIQGVTGNTDPNAIDDEIEFPSNKNKNIFVLDNDVDPDGDSLKIVQIGSQNALYEADGNPKTAKYTLPSGGKVKLIKITKEGKNQGKHVIRYFPSEDHKKITTETTDTFTYSIEDGKNGLDTATVQVTIQPTVFAD
ncbi:MAG: Ig-like domain-containing protein [Cyanobacteria bacterium P01_G01_bin.19]